MSKKSIIFFSKAPMNYVMFQRIHKILKEDKRLNISFTGKTEDGSPVKSIYSQFFNENEEKIIPLFWSKLKFPDIYISPDMYVACKYAKTKIHIFHGVSFKGKAYSQHIMQYDKIFLIGDYMKRTFIKKKILSEDDKRFVMIGMPKTDPLLDGSLNKKEILSKLDINDSKPVVLYSPTWRKECSLNTMGEEIISVMKKTDFHFLIKIHDLSLNPKTNKRDWGKYLKENEGNNIKVIYDKDIIPYMFATDILISDASSTANEFTLLDRPIIFMDVPKLLEKYSATADLETWGRKIGKIISSPSYLPGTIEQQLNNPKEYSEIRKAAAKDIFANHGNATQKAVKELYKILNF